MSDNQPDGGARRPSAPSLASVADALGPVVVEVAIAPKGLEVEVGGVVINDPVEPAPPVEPGDLVLAVGVRGGDPQALALLRAAATRGAAAVALRTPVSAEACETAEQAGVAVLGVPAEVSWAHLHGLLRTAIASAGHDLGAGDEPAAAGDLFALANAVAAMVGGPVTIEDPQSRVLAYSSLGHEIDEARWATIIGRRVPQEWMERLRAEGVFARLWSSDDVVEYRGSGQERLVIAIRAGGEILGSLWAADGGKPFHPSAPAALREAAAMAALHLVRHRMSEDLERRMRGEVLRSLLDGRGAVEALASRLGLDPATPCTVVAFELEQRDDAAVALARERVRDLVVSYCEAYRRRMASTSMERVLYVLLPSQSAAEDPLPGIVRLAQDVVRRADDALSTVVRAAIGSTVPALGEVPRSRADADRVLAVLATGREDRRVASVEDVRASVSLLELQRFLAEHPDLRLPKLDQLARHDEEHGTEYLTTLRAYLDAFGDVVQAAARVFVHPNTFRYRLRRLMELSGLDLSDADERVVVELQLRTR